jgi:hypothetical protein
MNALLNTLTEAELALVRETERAAIAEADEDDLVQLHERVRRARNKYVGMYRREASARVAEWGGRGKARPKNLRNAQKAEVFEDALARVSRQLAVAARRSAQELRASKRVRAMPGAVQATGKRQASDSARGARTQGRRDSK